MTKRPTDHLEPAPKKRSGDRQISREEPPSDSEGEEDPGEGFTRADELQLKKRKIFRARRGGQPAPTPVSADTSAAGAPAGSNPFTGISLTPAAAINPFAGVSLAAPAAPKATEAAAVGSAPEPASTAAAAPASDAAPAKATPEETAAGEPQKAAEAAAAAAEAAAEERKRASGAGSNAEEAAGAPSGNAFASFAASNSKSGFGAMSADTAAASNSFGNGTSLGSPSFASFSAPPAASMPATSGFSFTPGANTSFTFSTTSAPASSSFPAMTSIFNQSSQPATGVFGGSSPPIAPAVSLPPEDAHRVTGEEEERSVYTGDGTLFEYDEAERQWRERGRGEMKVNVGSIGKARLIMRNKGNFRLLLNANIWPGMKVTPMDGGKEMTVIMMNATVQAALTADWERTLSRMQARRQERGVTFIVMNAAQVPTNSKPGEEPKQDASDAPKDGKMSTWAYRVKMANKLEEFKAAVNEHKAPLSAAESNV